MLTDLGIPFLHWLIRKVENFHDWMVDFAEVLCPC